MMLLTVISALKTHFLSIRIISFVSCRLLVTALDISLQIHCLCWRLELTCWPSYHLDGTLMIELIVWVFPRRLSSSSWRHRSRSSRPVIMWYICSISSESFILMNVLWRWNTTQHLLLLFRFFSHSLNPSFPWLPNEHCIVADQIENFCANLSKPDTFELILEIEYKSAHKRNIDSPETNEINDFATLLKTKWLNDSFKHTWKVVSELFQYNYSHDHISFLYYLWRLREALSDVLSKEIQ